MDWRVKSLAFSVLSRIPYGGECHYLAQRYLLGSFPRPRIRLDALWDKARHFVEAYDAFGSGVPLAAARFLEIGAGRDLSVPVALRLIGVGHVDSIDVARLAKLDLVAHAAAHMAAKAGVAPVRFDSWGDVEAFGITYRAPADVRSCASGSVECMCSNEVLEHLPVAALEVLATETQRVLAADGIAVHTIDYSDHYARSDAGIDRFNFLTFDDDAWRKYNSAFQYVNRLRPSDYVRIFESAGLQILSAQVTPGVPKTTSKQRLAEAFQRYGEADLFALNGRLVLGNRASPMP